MGADGVLAALIAAPWEIFAGLIGGVLVLLGLGRRRPTRAQRRARRKARGKRGGKRRR